jgi:hypothetical protein
MKEQRFRNPTENRNDAPGLPSVEAKPGPTRRHAILVSYEGKRFLLQRGSLIHDFPSAEAALRKARLKNRIAASKGIPMSFTSVELTCSCLLVRDCTHLPADLAPAATATRAP